MFLRQNILDQHLLEQPLRVRAIPVSSCPELRVILLSILAPSRPSESRTPLLHRQTITSVLDQLYGALQIIRNVTLDSRLLLFEDADIAALVAFATGLAEEAEHLSTSTVGLVDAVAKNRSYSLFVALFLLEVEVFVAIDSSVHGTLV